MDYDIFAGVSSGSVTSCGMAMYKKGETAEALEHMANFSRWFTPQPYMQNFIWHGFEEPYWLAATTRGSAADWTEGWPMFRSGFDKPLQRPCRVGASDLQTGDVFSIKAHEFPFEKQVLAIQASCTLPVGSEPNTDFGTAVLVDGGIYAAINLQDAIDDCRQIVDDDSQIYIDINVCGASVNEHQEIRKLERQSHFNMWNIHKQVEDLYAFYLSNEDWLPILYANPDINLRNFIIPRKHIEGSLIATGTTSEMMDQQEAQGYQVGKDAALGVNQYMKEILVKHWDDYVDSITREGFD